MHGRLIFRGTLVAGTLDILSAFLFGGLAGAGPVRILHSVAAGPFGEGIRGTGIGGAALGLIVHFSIMSVMVGAFVLAAARQDLLVRKPVLSGLIYGLLLYLVMYWIVLPYRWPTAFPQTGAWQVGNALFSHLICVGLPIALIAAHAFKRPKTANSPALPAATA